MLTSQNDSELIAQYISTRDAQLREAVILRYVPLVHFVLGRLGISRSLGAAYEDFLNQGIIGLIEAVDRFDPGHGTQFSTYATLRVRGQVLDYLRASDWMPRAARRRARQVQDAIHRLWGELRRAPTDEELAEYLHLTMAQLHQTLSDMSRVIVSLDSFSVFETENDLTPHEVLADENQHDPSKSFDDLELKQRLVGALKQLSEREQLILSLYYYEELTLKEIGAVLGVSESRVSQLHTRTVINLREILRQEEGGKMHPDAKQNPLKAFRDSPSSAALPAPSSAR